MIVACPIKNLKGDQKPEWVMSWLSKNEKPKLMVQVLGPRDKKFQPENMV